MSTVGDIIMHVGGYIMSTVGVFSTVGYIMSTVEGVQYCGGYHEYRGVFSTVEVIMSTVGGCHDTCEEIS